jgi:glycosyltransferase involved in cell wall biosynthesis
VGNPKPHKGLDVLLGAFAKLAENHADIGLTLVGSDTISDQVARHPFRERITMPGRVTDEDLRTLYREATVFCLPSRYEGFGLPALEAMAAGVPVVAAAAGAIPEVVGDAALLVAAGDTDALARGLERVLADAPTASRLVAAGGARASGFTWDRCAVQTCSSYLAAAGGSS